MNEIPVVRTPFGQRIRLNMFKEKHVAITVRIALSRKMSPNPFGLPGQTRLRRCPNVGRLEQLVHCGQPIGSPVRRRRCHLHCLGPAATCTARVGEGGRREYCKVYRKRGHRAYRSPRLIIEKIRYSCCMLHICDKKKKVLTHPIPFYRWSVKSNPHASRPLCANQIN